MIEPMQYGEALSSDYVVQQHLNSVWSRQRDCLCIAKLARPDGAQLETNRARLLEEGRYLTTFPNPISCGATK